VQYLPSVHLVSRRKPLEQHCNVFKLSSGVLSG
jgi:hypothetical protein